MLLKIQQKSTAFAKIDNDTAQEQLIFKLPLVSLKQFEKFLHISLKTVENFSDSKPQPPWAKKVGRKPDPKGSENVRIKID